MDPIKLDICDLRYYRGEKLLLPMQWRLFDENYLVEDRIVISKDIKPLWLSATLGHMHDEKYFNDYNIEYLRAAGPIGCRDERTKNELVKRGIEAYLLGCLTALFPKRTITPNAEGIFFSDVPIEVLPYIPNLVRQKAKFIEQQWYGSYPHVDELRDEIRTHYNNIKERATMIVTSRLHLVSPCLAWGIPVVLCKNLIDDRFSWIDKYISIYSIDNFSQIDWKPQTVDYENIKEKELLVLGKWVQNGKVNDSIRKGLKEVDKWFSERKRCAYADFRDMLYKSRLDKIESYLGMRGVDKETEFSYALWGAGKTGRIVFDYISRNYRNARLTHVIDKYLDDTFEGIYSIRPLDYFVGEMDDVLFVTGVGAAKEAMRVREMNNNIDKTMCYCVDTFVHE